MKYWGVYFKGKKDRLTFVSTDKDKAYDELINCWFDGYNCAIKQITQKEYENFKEED